MHWTFTNGCQRFLLPALLLLAKYVIKIDSTKKICGKLQGKAAGSASWHTNVGNEQGEVLICVLTESEGLDALRPMAVGLIQR